MADPRTFTLIGEFKDGITPELEKINKQLAALKANFAGVGSRKNTGFRGATKEIGKLVSAHKNLADSVKHVGNELRSTTSILQQYRREMGKAAAATRAFQKAGGRLGGDQFTKDMGAANRAAQAYLRTIRQINAESRRTPRGGMGGGFQPPRPPRGRGMGMGEIPRPGRTTAPGGGGRGRDGGVQGMSAHMAEFGFAYTLGSAIAQPIQNAIISGFQIGVGLMTKPFEYFANAFGERVQDQLSDLKAAGGLFSISKRSQTPFLATIDEAIQYQQDTNRVFAKMAASLPGVTNDYVQVGKRLSDTMGRIAAGDFQNALQEANRIRATEEGRKFYGGTITGTGKEATKEVITTLLGEMTKKTTIAGLGGRSGAGGIAGAYGLPGLTERMLSQQEVSMGQFQRYAAVFSDPTIQDALSRNVDLINSTLPNTTARFKAMQKLLDEVVTPDLIEKLRTSVDGIYQGLRSAVLDPDTGLFGLGRQFEDFGYKINQYGQYVVDKEGKKIKDSLSIFEIVSDIFSNAGQAILPLVEALPLIFDPLKKVASILMDARHYAAEFNRTFNMYREGLKKLSEMKGKEFLKDSLDVRASLSAVSNFLYQFGAIGRGEFESIGKQLMSKDLDIGGMLKRLLDSVLNSKIAGEIGATIGEIIGVVISEVAGVTGFISGRIAKSNKLFEGIKSGFEKAGGPAALSAIFRDVFKSMLKALLSIGKLIPIEGYLIGAAALVMPAVAQGLGMKIGELALNFIGKFGKFFDKSTGPALKQMKDAVKLFFDQLIAFFRGRFAKDLSVQQVVVRDLGADVPKGLPPAATPKALPPAGALAAPRVAQGMSAFAKFMGYIKGVGPRFMGFFKGLFGKLTILGGVITSLVSLFQGKDLATALAEGAGPVLGAALGAALVPFLGPIGPMIGSAIGGWIGSLKSVTEPLADGIRAVFGTIQTTFDLLGQIGRDLIGVVNGFVQLMPGVSQNFDFLRAAVFALISPFKLLEIAINGLYDLYLWIKSKTVGVSTEERARMNERRTVKATDEFTIMGREGAGYSLAQQKAAEYAKFQEAKAKGDTVAMNRIAEYMKSIDRMIAQRGGNAGVPPKPGTAKPTPAKATVPSKPIGTGATGVSRPVGGAPAVTPTRVTTPAPVTAPSLPSPQLVATATNTAATAAAAGRTAAATGQINQKTAVQVAKVTQTNATLATIQSVMGTLGGKLDGVKAAILAQTVAIRAGNMAVVGAINNLASSGGLGGMGGMGGGIFNLPTGDGVKKVVSAGRMLQGMGLNVAENPHFGSGRVGRHAPGSYHYAGRAIDVTGPPAQLDAAYAKLKGTNPAELLWRTAGHYDHLHVAYATGYGMPFTNAMEAMRFERAMTPGSVKVGSITGNSAEGFGGGTTINGGINVTVNGSGVNDPDELASIIALKIGDAVAQTRAASVFV